MVCKEPFQDPASSLSLSDDKKELKAHYQNIVLRSKRAAFNEMFTKGEKRSFASLNEEKQGRKTTRSGTSQMVAKSAQAKLFSSFFVLY